MLGELQSGIKASGGRLELDTFGVVAGRYNGCPEFRQAGVSILPFVSDEGGFVLATACGPEEQQQLVHVAAGAHWYDMLGDIQTAGRGQGVDRYDQPRIGEEPFAFQRRALYTLMLAMRDWPDQFATVDTALVQVAENLPLITRGRFSLPTIGANAIINLAYARTDGIDIMGVPYERLVQKYGMRIGHDDARAIVAFETSVQIGAILNGLHPAITRG